MHRQEVEAGKKSKPRGLATLPAAFRERKEWKDEDFGSQEKGEMFRD